MQLRYINMIVAAVAILAISFCQENEIYARALVGRTGSVHRAAASAAARAARIAAQNPQLTAQQALTLAKFDERQAAIATGLMTSNKVLAAELAAKPATYRATGGATGLRTECAIGGAAGHLLRKFGNRHATHGGEHSECDACRADRPTESPAYRATGHAAHQPSNLGDRHATSSADRGAKPPAHSAQATLPASIVQSPAAIATQIAESNSAGAELAAQIAGQNPQISAQQATFQANQQFAAIAAELAAATTPSTATPTQQNAVNIPRVGVFPEFPAFTPGFGPSGSLGNGAFQPAVPVEESGGGRCCRSRRKLPPGPLCKVWRRSSARRGNTIWPLPRGRSMRPRPRARRCGIWCKAWRPSMISCAAAAGRDARGARSAAHVGGTRQPAARRSPHGLDAEQIDLAHGRLALARAVTACQVRPAAERR